MSTLRVARRSRFTTIDQRTVNDARLSFRARGVLVWLLDKPDDWRCNADQIAAAGSEGREAVRSALRELEKHGYLRRDRHQDAEGHWVTTTTVYETPTEAQEPVVGYPAAGAPDLGQPDPGSLGADTKTVTKDYEPKTMTKEHTTPAADLTLIPPTVAPSARVVEDETFEKFWSAYPQKVDKPAARRAWRKAMKRGDTVDQIRSGFKLWSAHWAAGGMIPYPATWLNGERYKNEPPVVTAAGKVAKDHSNLAAALTAARVAPGASVAP